MIESSIPAPNLLSRSTGYALLQFINNNNILGYRIRVASSLDDAYGNFNGVGGAGTYALFDVKRGNTFISKAIVKRKTGLSGDITRGQTRATFDPNEYFGEDPQVPPDSRLWFIRTQVSTVVKTAISGGTFTGGFPASADNLNQSKIYIMRDPTFNSVPMPALTLYGTAPAVGANPGEPAPPEALVFSTPSVADSINIINHSATDPLLVSVGVSQMLMEIPPSTSINHTSGMKDDFVVCANSGNPKFSMFISTISGLR